jgi:hypothetical protein
MNIEKLEKQVTEDLYIDDTILVRESLVTPIKHNKYLQILFRERLQLKRLKSDLGKVRLERTNYYNGNAEDPYEFVLSTTEVKEHVKCDPDFISFEARVAIQEEVVSYLEEVCLILSRRGFSIKNAIDMLKFQNAQN